MGLGEKGEAIKKKKKKEKTFIDTATVWLVITRGKEGWEEAEQGIGGINHDGRRLDLGW